MQTKSGKDLNPIGIGGWAVTQNDIEALKYSLNKGQNHIDTAEMYGAGESELAVGQAIQDFNREDLYIATKVWKDHVGKGQVRPAVENMLERLGTDYIDLLYIHAPWPDAPWAEAVPQINDLIDDGTVRHFGISNFTVANMEETKKLSKHAITANQMYYNCLDKSEVPPEFMDYCKQNNIQIVAYTPVARGVLNHPTLNEIAQKHKSTPAQIALAWCLAKGTLPIPKATNPKHIDENLAALDIKLSDEEIAKLDAL